MGTAPEELRHPKIWGNRFHGCLEHTVAVFTLQGDREGAWPRLPLQPGHQTTVAPWWVHGSSGKATARGCRRGRLPAGGGSWAEAWLCPPQEAWSRRAASSLQPPDPESSALWAHTRAAFPESSVPARLTSQTVYRRPLRRGSRLQAAYQAKEGARPHVSRQSGDRRQPSGPRAAVLGWGWGAPESLAAHPWSQCGLQAAASPGLDAWSQEGVLCTGVHACRRVRPCLLCGGGSNAR